MVAITKRSSTSFSCSPIRIILSILGFLFMIWMGFLLSWEDTITTTTSISNSEVQQLRRDNNNIINNQGTSALKKKKNHQHPTSVEFINPDNNNNDKKKDDDKKDKVSDADDAGSSSSSLSSSCHYKSLSQLTEQELQPKTGIDHRHITTPPMGGKVSLVCCETTVGPLTILAHSNWAPLGTQRFLEMVTSGYMNAGVPLFRCMTGFLCQFGLSSDPTKAKDFRKTLPDDPQWLPKGPKHRKDAAGVSRFSQGYLAYAGAGQNSRSKQFIVALKDNGPLGGGSPWEVPWGELVGPDSFETLSKIYTGYGDNGPSQGRLNKEGMSDALRNEFPKLDYINRCDLLDERIIEEPF